MCYRSRPVPGRVRQPTLRRLGGSLPLVLLLLAACGRSATQGGEAGSPPHWIWRNHDLRHVEAAAFYLVREFELGAAPRASQLRLVADESYVLFLNERRVGSGRWRSGRPGDSYEVAPLLRPGRNRLIAELHSATGAGGFWLDLVADGLQVVRSDGDWVLYRGAWRGLFRYGQMPDGEPPLDLGAGPLGRWGELETFAHRPNFEETLADAEPVPATSARDWGSEAAWQSLSEPSRRSPSLGPLVEIDFGEERVGYLQLAYRDSGRDVDPPALIRFGVEPLPAPPTEADLVFRPIPGRNLFQDETPRRFRYVAVAGLPGLFGVEVLTVREEAMATLDAKAPARPELGVFGVRPPRSRSPVENEIWRELERSAGLRIRKDR